MKCSNCPRMCPDRNRGFCGVGEDIFVSRIAPHYWEEPCISGTKGSGALFFSGCNLKCVFCQNHDISFKPAGKKYTVEELAVACDSLIEQGVHNLNFVTPTPYITTLEKLLSEYKFSVPIVYNTSSFENVSALEKLNSKVDIYLADMKFKSSKLSSSYTGRSDYFNCAVKAIEQMYLQVGDAVYDSDGLLKKGLVVRHLVLPDCIEDTKDIIDWFVSFSKGKKVVFSLMSQYTPCLKCEYDNLNRTLSEEEYKQVCDYIMLCGVDGYMQDLSSADERYIPDFCGQT